MANLTPPVTAAPVPAGTPAPPVADLWSRYSPLAGTPAPVDCAQAGVVLCRIPVKHSNNDEVLYVGQACKDFFSPGNYCKYGKYCHFAHDMKDFGKVRPRLPGKADTDKYRIYLCKQGSPRE